MSKLTTLFTATIALLFVVAAANWVTAEPTYAQGGPNVTVVNGPARPVPVTVTNGPGARVPFMKNSGLLIGPVGLTGASFDIDVPVGFRLVVEKLSYIATDSTSERCQFQLIGTFNGAGTGQIPVTGQAFSQPTVSDTVPVLAFFDGGTSVHVLYIKNQVGSLSNVIINVSGYLEPVS